MMYSKRGNQLRHRESSLSCKSRAICALPMGLLRSTPNTMQGIVEAYLAKPLYLFP